MRGGTLVRRAHRHDHTSATRGTPCDATSHSPSLSAIRPSAVWRDELSNSSWSARTFKLRNIAIALRAMRRCLRLPEKKKVGAQRIGLCAARCARMVVSVSDYLPTSRRATARILDALKGIFVALLRHSFGVWGEAPRGQGITLARRERLAFPMLAFLFTIW